MLFVLAIVANNVYCLFHREQMEMNMLQITHENRIRLDIHEFEVHQFSAEASTLGFPVGHWPTTIETTLGNKLPFIASTRKIRDGDLLWVTYRQANGCISLRVYND